MCRTAVRKCKELGLARALQREYWQYFVLPSCQGRTTHRLPREIRQLAPAQLGQGRGGRLLHLVLHKAKPARGRSRERHHNTYMACTHVQVQELTLLESGCT